MTVMSRNKYPCDSFRQLEDLVKRIQALTVHYIQREVTAPDSQSRVHIETNRPEHLRVLACSSI